DVNAAAPFLPSVLFVTAELSPWATTGGLGEVSAALPRALAALGHRVAVVAPLHRAVRERAPALRQVASIDVPGFGAGFPVLAAESRPGGPEVYFIEHQGFFDRAGLYADAFGDYRDNLERFAFFSRSALEVAVALELPTDILHCNDWHTGLAGAYLRTFYAGRAPFRAARIVFTIHNLAYQGRFPAERFPVTGLPWSLFRYDWVEFYGQLNALKSGIVFADRITTVSAGYAAEVLTPEYGEGLAPVLQHRRSDLVGIRNGIDVERWNPATDPFLPARYDADDLAGKGRCREALVEELELSLPREAPLLAMVTRLTWQKGADIVLGVAAELLRSGSPPGPGPGLVLLGSGDAGLEKAYRDLAARHPDRVGVRIGFDEPLAHRIEAGADVFLMPSRYEPCGLNQMYSLRYGTVPVVRDCGGLGETVRDATAEPEAGNGFKFREATGHALLESVGRAVTVHRERDRWKELMRRGMAEDYSWARSAKEYSTLYADLVREPPREWRLPG
ncbi:MAG: glycogen synthase GlgA, partial [Candidatus Binatia bacterium]